MNQASQDVIEHRRTTNELSGEHMIYELRVYRVVQGRMAALLTRFEHQTLPIMVRYGFLQVGFWTTIVGRSEQLTYLLAWKSLAQRQEQWAAFESDAEWLALRKSTEENGLLIFEIESSLLRPTNFSAAK
jgi:NIPSNAP